MSLNMASTQVYKNQELEVTLDAGTDITGHGGNIFMHYVNPYGSSGSYTTAMTIVSAADGTALYTIPADTLSIEGVWGVNMYFLAEKTPGEVVYFYVKEVWESAKAGVITVDDVKNLLNITDTAKDGLIDMLIPMVQDRLIKITGNPFTVKEIDYTGAVTFDASGDTITASNSFEAQGFADGDEIALAGSYRNDGYYKVASVSSAVITLSDDFDVVDELSGANVVIRLVKWEPGVKPVVANMIKYDMDERPGLRGIGAERFGDYQVTFQSNITGGGGMGYPRQIINGLAPYMRVRFV